MQRSESINEIAAALAKAQAVIVAAEKNAENPHFKSNYADLAAVWNACRLPLSKNGLSITQVHVNEGQGVILESLLMHSSGQWILSRLPLMMLKQDMQGLGSATTYARRYALAAMAGVAQEDDDGNGAGQANARSSARPPQSRAEAPSGPQASSKPAGATNGPKPKEQPTAGPQAPGPLPGPGPGGPDVRGANVPWVVTKDKVDILQRAATARGWSKADLGMYLTQRWKRENVTKLTREEYNTFLSLVSTYDPLKAAEQLAELQAKEPQGGAGAPSATQAAEVPPPTEADAPPPVVDQPRYEEHGEFATGNPQLKK